MGNRGRRSYHATKPRSRLTLTTPQSREATKPLADIPSLALLNAIKPSSCKKRKTWSNLSAQRARPRSRNTLHAWQAMNRGFGALVRFGALRRCDALTLWDAFTLWDALTLWYALLVSNVWTLWDALRCFDALTLSDAWTLSGQQKTVAALCTEKRLVSKSSFWKNMFDNSSTFEDQF